jgi:hypothetical protein
LLIKELKKLNAKVTKLHLHMKSRVTKYRYKEATQVFDKGLVSDAIFRVEKKPGISVRGRDKLFVVAVVTED